MALVLLALFFVATGELRDQLGLELTAESIRQAVSELGWWAPAGYLGLVAIRQFLALPSMLVLGAAGLLFGTALGSILGGVGMTLNALLLFTIARNMGANWVRHRLHARFPNFEDRARTAGPLIIALATAHPMGPQTAFHFGAGVTPMPAWAFAAAVLPAAIFRAACYAFLGAHILEPTSPQFWAASAVLFVISVAPLAHPGLRARLFGQSVSATSTAAPPFAQGDADTTKPAPPEEGAGS